MFTNERLIDVLNRHQIYVEGVKAWEHKRFDETLKRLDEMLIDLFKTIRVKQLDELTRYALRNLIAELRRSQFTIYSEYTTKVIDDLKAFMAADLLVSKVLFSTMQRPEDEDETPVSEADATGDLFDAFEENKDNKTLLPFGFLTGSDEANDKLWGKITNTPIPANGLNLLPFIAGFTASASNSIERLIMKGYANRLTPGELLDEIRGTKANNYRDGQLTRIYQQANAMGSTSLQFVSAITQSAVASAYHKRYIWASVIDSKTTPICRSRNGRIYEYGSGPLPPAHINCRSKDIPITDEDEQDIELVTPQWFSWLQRQPEKFRNDYLANARAQAKDKDFAGMNPISITNFKNKVDLLLIR